MSSNGSLWSGHGIAPEEQADFEALFAAAQKDLEDIQADVAAAKSAASAAAGSEANAVASESAAASSALQTTADAVQVTADKDAAVAAKDAALLARSDAENFRNDANLAQGAAASSASAASTSETNAASSESAAASSASAASTSETNAASSESAAASSASAASTSETNAASSESAASTSETNAASSASSSAASANAAATSATNAAASESAAATSATNAAASESAAATSATNAAASESAAATSETNAAASESAAATASTNAAASAALAFSAAARMPSFTSKPAGTTLTLGDDGEGSVLVSPVGDIKLPALSSVPAGWTHFVWFSGSPAAFQSNFIETQSGDTIRHRGVPVVGKCYFPGDDIVVRVSCADFGGKVWLTEIIQNIKPGIALGTTHNSGTVYHNGPTSWSTTNRTAESLGTYFAAPIANNTAIQVPVTGLYSLAGHVYYSAAAGGGVSGSAFAIFGHNSVLQQAWAAAHRYFVVNEDTGYLDITTTRALKQGDLVQLYHQASSASLYFRPGKNYLRVELVSL